MRNWRERNKEKVREYNRRYWLKKTLENGKRTKETLKLERFLGITLQEVKNLKQRALRTVAFRSYKVRKLAKEWLECRTPDYYTTSRIFDGVGYHTSYKKDSIVERIVIARDETVARLVE